MAETKPGNSNVLLKVQAVNEYSGKQILIKSDRIVLNAFKNDVIIGAKSTLALAASNEIHINSAGNLYLNVKDGSKVIIGKPGSDTRKGDQPAVLGTNLSDFLDELMQLLITFQTVSSAGEGQAGPLVGTKVQELKKRYLSSSSENYILSDLLHIADNAKKK